jgi:malate synthase
LRRDTSVAHPGLVAVAKALMSNTRMNQILKQRDDVHYTASDLLDFRPETITEAIVRNNIQVRYSVCGLMKAGGNGLLPIFQSDGDAACRKGNFHSVWQ